MLQWLLFGGAPLLVAIWVAIAAMRVPEEDRLRAIGIAASQGCAGTVLLYGAAGALFFLWLIATTLSGPSA